MVEKVKNEHYVPQRYLKHFANGETFLCFFEMYERVSLLLMKKNAKTDKEREYINSIELEIKII